MEPASATKNKETKLEDPREKNKEMNKNPLGKPS